MTRRQLLFLKTLLLFFILSGCISIPEADKQKGMFVIVPGKGFWEITLGEAPSAVLKVMGEPENRTTYEEEREAYASSGFNPDNQLEFLLGFDLCFEYSSRQNHSMYPIYKIFFKDNKVHVIMFSAFVYEPKFLQNIFISSKDLKFHSNTEDMKQVLGTNYVFRPLIIYEISDYQGKGIPEIIENYEIYDYLENGISVIVENNEIVSVQIYPPVSPDIKQQYKGKIIHTDSY